MAYPNQSLALTHPTFRARALALRDAVRDELGGDLGFTSTTRTAAVQTAMYVQWRRGLRRASAANPAGYGPMSPWGWRQRGSFHMQQQDGWGHAIDFWREGVAWGPVHDLAADFGVRFPLLHLRVPEPWHGQWWNGPAIYPAPRMADPSRPAPPPIISIPPVPVLTDEEPFDMYEFTPQQRPGVAVLDYTWLPSEGSGPIPGSDGRKIYVFAKLYVRRPMAKAGPSHVKIYQGGKLLTDADFPGMFDRAGLVFLPEDGQPIEIPVRQFGFCSIESFHGGAPGGPLPVSVVQHQAFIV